VPQGYKQRMNELENSEFIKKVADTLEIMEKEFELSTEDFPWEDYEEGEANVSIHEDDKIHLSLPRSDDSYNLKYCDLFPLLDELKSAKLIDNAECITKNRYLIRVQPVFSETQSDFYSAMEHIESQDGGAFIMEHTDSGITYKCRIIDGFTVFGVMVAVSGNYDKYFPPVSSDDIFVEIESTANGLSLEIFRAIFKSYVFELSSSLSFDITMSPRPELVHYDEDTPKKKYIEKFRPLLSGKGLSEPLNLYNKAIESTSPDIAILYFAKVIEFVSQTVIRIQLTEKIRTKLLSQRALDPDAEYIKELGRLYEDNKIYNKDKDAIKLAITTCCEATELAPIVPKCLGNKWNAQMEKSNTEKALQELAYCIASTRNSIAHAKANYEQTGSEVPEEEFDQLSKCMRLCSQQVIRWYASRHESQRIW